jgi:hypothetical protein
MVRTIKRTLRLSVLLSVVVSGRALAGTLDLTPIVAASNQPRAKEDQRLLFRDRDRTASYVPPRGWTYYGTKDKLTLEANDGPRSNAAIEQISLQVPAPFNEETLKILQSEMINALPKESQDIKIIHVERNPLMIDDHETIEITLSYYLLGAERMKSILFVNLGDSQLRFTLSSLKADFGHAHELFRRSYYTWQSQ